MTARFLVGDTRDRLADIPDHTVDLVLTSPPFLALRSYLPEDHPDKDREIGSEATPAEFIDVLLELTAEWGRVLAPHGSIAVELGDTYAGSGGAGGDYRDDGLRDGQPRFRQQPPNKSERFNADGTVRTTAAARATEAKNRTQALPLNGGNGWPLPKSLACIPQLYQVALAYGINPLTGAESPAGRWRVRTLKPWIRSNPPVGALGDKERPATSYVIVACRATDRWFDLDAVRTSYNGPPPVGGSANSRQSSGDSRGRGGHRQAIAPESNPGGAPPRDWWHHVDAILDTELALRAGKASSGGRSKWMNESGHNNRDFDPYEGPGGAQGVHLRRALERAGILTTLEALDVSPRGYSGAHYAVWPPELVRLLVDEMCPRRVCTTCGQPSRRLTEVGYEAHGNPAQQNAEDYAQGSQGQYTGAQSMKNGRATKHTTTLGWSDCGHGTWRPGHVLDPFAGSGTTLAVAQGMGRQATGIDIDERNAWLARERVGMFLEVDEISREDPATGSLTTGVNQ